MSILHHIDIWAFLGGLGIFLFGMYFLEDALRNLAGSSFKRFLRSQTSTPFQGIFTGTLATAILQSSSLVTLMLLAFVGAGIMSLHNALGVILGSNLGTTFTGWLVATIGFRVDIASFALPCIAVGGLTITFFRKRQRIFELGRLLIGFGFLFLGLEYMKGAIEGVTETFDVSAYREYHPYMFFPIGLGLTAIIQSSSATMVIILSALNAQILSLPAAAAMVIGADLGTTITAVLGSLGGSAQKKQVASAHVLFNVISDGLALLLMFPLLGLLVQISSIRDPLLILVLFHSSFNLLGILIVAPFLGKLASFLQHTFSEDSSRHAHFISRVSTDVPEASLEALDFDIRQLLREVFALNLQALRIRDALFEFPVKGSLKPYLEQYESIKELEGEIVNYCLTLQGERLSPEETNRVTQLTLCVRSAVLSAKSLKDIGHNFRDFERSANDVLLSLQDSIRSQFTDVYARLDRIGMSENPLSQFEALVDALQLNKRTYDELLSQVHEQIKLSRLGELETSTLLNVCFESYNATRAFISAMKDFMLQREQALDFNNLPEMR